MMSAANRMETPFMRGARGMYGRHGVSGDPMLSGMAAMANEPDYSQFTYDPAMRAQAVAAGVQPLEASQVKQNVLLPNTGFFGEHPRLSRALEAGIFGAAAARGGETAGESIQGTLEGIIGGKRIREGLQRQQFSRPFEAAGALEGLRDMQQRRELQAAQIKHYSDESDIQAERADVERQKLGLGYDKLAATRPVPVEGGAYTFDQEKGWQFQPGAGKPTTEHDLDIGTREQLRIMGIKDISQATPDQIAQANAKAQRQAVERGAAMAGATTRARGDVTAPQKAAAARDKWIKDNSSISAKSAGVWMAAGIAPGDPKAAQKLAAFYDTNIAPYLTAPATGPLGSSEDNAITIP